MVAIEVGDVKRGRRVDMRQAAQRDQAIVIGLGIVARPGTAEAAVSEAAAVGVARRVHQTRPIKFVRYCGATVIELLAESLKSIQREAQREQESDNRNEPDQLHWQNTSELV